MNANQPSMRSLLLARTTNDSQNQLQGRHFNINGIAFIANLKHGLLLKFNPIMGSFGCVLKKGCDTLLADIQPVTPFHMAEAAVKILDLQSDCRKPHIHEDGRERLPKNVSLVLVIKANTATEPFFQAFLKQFHGLMINFLNDKDCNRHVQGALGNMKTTPSGLRHSVSPDKSNGGQSA